MIRGEGFCGASVPDGASCAESVSGSAIFGLEFPAARAPVQDWTATSLVVTVPDAASLGDVDVVVNVDGQASNGREFEVLP